MKTLVEERLYQFEQKQQEREHRSALTTVGSMRNNILYQVYLILEFNSKYR